MKKKFFDYKLQLLAEGGNPDGGDPEGGNPDGDKPDGGKPEGGKPEGGEPDGDGKPKAKYTDEDVDRLLDKKFAEWQTKKEKELAEAERKAKLSAEERAKEEREEMQKQLDEYKAKESRSMLQQTARKTLTGKGINAPDEIVDLLAKGTAEETADAAESFAKLFKEEVDKAVKDALKGNPPRKGGKEGVVTKKDIMAIKNPVERQKQIAEHMDLFEKKGN